MKSSTGLHITDVLTTLAQSCADGCAQATAHTREARRGWFSHELRAARQAGLKLCADVLSSPCWCDQCSTLIPAASHLAACLLALETGALDLKGDLDWKLREAARILGILKHIPSIRVVTH